jgi:hypothetical protein
MPTVSEVPITALAFCIDGRCPGYNQQPVEAVKRVTEFSYVELGGDLPGIERSTEAVMFADDGDAVCSHCGKPRLVSEQERPEYPNTSGQDPLAIFNRQGAANQLREIIGEQEKEKLRHQAETSELRTMIAEQSARMEQMASLVERQAGVIDELQSRPRGPGRPRKVEGNE